MGLRSPPTVFSDLTTLPRSCLFLRKETWVWQKVICITDRLTESPTQTYVCAQVKLVSIDAADVADGNPSIILGLIWNIILFFQVIIFFLYILVCLITPSYFYLYFMFSFPFFSFVPPFTQILSSATINRFHFPFMKPTEVQPAGWLKAVNSC